MSALKRSRPLLLLPLLVAVTVVGPVASPGHAAREPALVERDRSLARAEATTLLELYAAESSLSRAQADAADLARRANELRRLEVELGTRTERARRLLHGAQSRVATLLRELYVQGEPDPIAVILGATSLEEAMTGIEGLSRAAGASERLSLEAQTLARRLGRLRAQLAVRRADVESAQSAARSSGERLLAAVSAKQRTLTMLRARRSLTAERLSALEERAREAGRRSAELAATAMRAEAERPAGAPGNDTPAPADLPTPTTPGGTRTLVVDAVAYHLEGSTASGIPVGMGVIAVDPAVIPLGTRVLVPGYGPAVAADVGSAIKGNIIDLWMPTTARARAWGRRTVTITVYG